jgi:uncharacterized membrane protein
MFKKYFVLFSLCVSFLLVGNLAYARDSQNITDWYIQNFETNIVVNKDSSLLITENITADCGNLADKHGIFRVLPTQISTDGGVFNNPVELVSITDFNGNQYKYQTINDSYEHTITWKIGDPKITVNGVNYYKIVYRVKNAVRFGNPNFDELYWNIMGNFWDIGTDNFSAHITFPSEINSQNSQVDYYTGFLDSKDKSEATYSWDSNNILNFISTTGYSFQPHEGISVSVTFPKNIFTPYVPTFMEKYGYYFWYLSFLIPLIIFIFAFLKWRKYGRDPKMKKPIPPEFGIPNNITPIQMGMVLSHGMWTDKLLTATIISLAVKKIITINQIEEKILFLSGKDLELVKNVENYDNLNLTKTEKIILDGIFGFEKKIKISVLKGAFYSSIYKIRKEATEDTITNGWITKEGNKYEVSFISLGILLIVLSIWMISLSGLLFFSIFLSGIILIAFALVMPKRTQAGVDLLFKIKGFELYMNEVEKYREQFNEKENIFDKFLPYAIVFGIAELWAKKMQLIYGEDYFKNYHPVWITGSIPTNFDLDSFTSQLNSISSSISSNTGGASGAGGGGGAGCGGGGGGGGGW